MSNYCSYILSNTFSRILIFGAPLIDVLFASSISSSAASTVGSAYVFTGFTMAIFGPICTTAISLQIRVKYEKATERECFGLSLLTGIVFAVIYLVFLLINMPSLMGFLNLDKDAASYFSSYFYIYLFFLSMLPIYRTYEEVSLASFGPHIVTVCAIVFLIVNLILNTMSVVLILDLQNRIDAIAFATVVSRGISLLILISFVHKNMNIIGLSVKNGHAIISFWKSVSKKSFPAMAEPVSTACAVIVFVSLFNGYGSEIASARFYSSYALFMTGALAWASSTWHRNEFAKHYNSMALHDVIDFPKVAYSKTIIPLAGLIFLISILVVVILIFAEIPPTQMKYLTVALLIGGFGEFGKLGNVLYGNLFIGMGDSRGVAVVNITVTWLVVIPMVIYLIRNNSPYYFPLIGMAADQFIRCTLLYFVWIRKSRQNQ